MKSRVLRLSPLLLITVIVCLQGCVSKTSGPENLTGKNDSSVTVGSSRIARVRLDRAGKIFLNGAQVSLDQLKVNFTALPQDGVVWFYREDPGAEPHAQAEAVIQAALEARLSVRLSSKSDYSDIVDSQGLSSPSR